MDGTPKKTHWTQTPEGRKRMASVQKKRWRKVRKKNGHASKAEAVIKRAVGKKAEPNRMDLYERAVAAAIAADELSRLIGLITRAMLMREFAREEGGRR